MKVVHRDLKNNEVAVVVETDDDLWVVDHVVRPGDVVFAQTYRKEERASDKLRPERAEKRRIHAGIRVEKMEFHQFSGALRIHGVLVEAPFDVGSYHTLIVEVGTKLRIVRVFTPLDLKIIDESVRDAGRPDVVFVSLDDEEATIAYMSSRGIQKVCDIKGPGSGKMFRTKHDDSYLAEVAETTAGVGGQYLVVVGPGFTKEAFAKYLREKQVLADRKVHIEAAGAAGMSGVNEVLKGGALSRFLKDSRTGEEMVAVERTLAAISSGGLAAYGLAEVRQALELGAVAELLILDTLARAGTGDALFDLARRTNADTLIISSGHDGGRRLDGLGGVAALLRYPIG
ncbi:MAG: mRNA surveillance protein pelota [Thermoplasmata archaeon]|nr:mRNA surveillance protein pelota [Thermoplasmata archaeon]